MSIMRWNPFRDLAARRSAMDRFFGDDWRSFMENMTFDEKALAVDVHEDDHAYTVTTELPGVEANNIHVNLEGDYLVIEGEIPEQKVKTKEDQRTLVQERRYGKLSRTIRLPQPVDSSKTEATYENGVLTLTLPKTATAKATAIPIKVGSK